jgi:hypothetical protein
MARALHPAENRGYRELYAYSRQLVDHWSALTERLAGTAAVEPLESGVDAVRKLLAELGPLTASYDLHGELAAQGIGLSLARQRTGVRDRFLERNQAVRHAVQDLQHVTVLLGYLGAVAQARRDEELAAFCGRWERRLRRVESSARKAAVELGADPDFAVEPIDSSPVGRAAHALSYAMGTAGEWIDRRAAERRGG